MKIKVWLDSGANIHSKRERIIDLKKVTGIEDEEWDKMSSLEKDEAMRDIAWESAEWGYECLS